ncbi:cation transport protein ChaC [Kushneria sinocarnis]|uniref:glutathione-specific gamma-glutamylcyclotransferase n=1 Tax=Kushneria sinocarnis TaxID=595502 RepID=A0A420WXC4_9GAMM|nr:gamma-glutamylcyclotransferase [Kushneria sinocarnis]RKR04386.1 cation transport protein ChaC [Kushneria sinocarnis]
MSDHTAREPQPVAMTREALKQDRIRTHFEKTHPEVALLTNDDFRESIAKLLNERPAGSEHIDGVYLFGYGSLVWNPCIEVAERRTVRLEGYHRDFCLSMEQGRGSPEAPGLMLSLQPGGFSEGVALRVAERDLDSELLLVWRREMLTGAYVPHWVTLTTSEGRFPGIAFVANPEHDRYIEGLAEHDIVHRLSTGEGVLGSCQEYLDNTVAHLRDLGIEDDYLEGIQYAVHALRGGAGR